MKKKNLIYLMGGGRSGTTILATILNEAKEITTLGEMHQFLDYLLEDRLCSCGETLNNCTFWKDIKATLLERYSIEELRGINKHNKHIESHSHIIKSWFIKDIKYIGFQEELLKIVSDSNKEQAYLDSAKYISRGLQLAKIKDVNLKIIYLVRDVRGVVNSFGKKVQTSKNPLSAIAYYSFINFFAQISAWILGKRRVLKFRYEDFVNDPINSLLKMQEFLNKDLSSIITKLESDEPFLMPHIIGGNRLTENKSITLNSDLQWKNNISRPKQIVYYILTAPFMLLNKYRI